VRFYIASTPRYKSLARFSIYPDGFDMRLRTRYVALRQRDLYHLENELSEFISNFTK
jgi:hypothetical protein